MNLTLEEVKNVWNWILAVCCYALLATKLKLWLPVPSELMCWKESPAV